MSNIEALKNRFLKGRITRREFLAQVSALGLAATLSPAYLGTPARAATPKSGGRCRIAYNDCGTSDGLDPTLSTSNCSGLLRGQLANPLVEEGPGGVLIPELAESWESSKDAKTWTFKLRQGVEFHNGKTFDVEDAIYSLATHRREGTKSQAKAYLADVQEIKGRREVYAGFYPITGKRRLPHNSCLCIPTHGARRNNRLYQLHRHRTVHPQAF